jgi:hypothetical protein
MSLAVLDEFKVDNLGKREAEAPAAGGDMDMSLSKVMSAFMFMFVVESVILTSAELLFTLKLLLFLSLR